MATLKREGTRFKVTIFAAIVLAALLGTLALGIELSQQQARSRVLANLKLRGTSSATFVGTFLAEQASRERQTAAQFLADPHVSPRQFELVVAAFGSGAAVLLDSSGRVLDVAPADPSLHGTAIAARYAHLTAAEHGEVAVSNVVPSAARGIPVVAVAVPFQTPAGRRVFSAAYGVSGSTLKAFVDHTISYKQHEVYLVDASGQLVAASPTTGATSLTSANPALARAAGHSRIGAVPGAKTATTFTAAAVPGTAWKLVIAIPDWRLYQSVSGWSEIVPWLVFALVSVLGVAAIILFARMTALSRRMAESALTDSLTGLFNRRAVTEHLVRATAYARRRNEPMALLMIDLDRFKQINDTHGHTAGDRVLCAVADCMRDVVRTDEICGRWGGDEFVVLIPTGDEHDGEVVAERLKAAASQLEMRNVGLPNGIRLSVGVASAVHTTPDEIVHAADVALYEVKRKRRVGNRVAAVVSARI